MRTLLGLVTLLAVSVAPAGAASDGWTPAAWADENTLELGTTAPGEEPYWFPVWAVTIDDRLYVRLGSRAGDRYARNATKPVLGVRIAGKTFDRVRAVETPEMAERVQAAMADKYWTQADFIVRRLSHPYTLRLEPATD
jgi:hypothetical protein